MRTPTELDPAVGAVSASVAKARSNPDYGLVTTAAMGAQRPRMDGRAVALALVALLVAVTALIIAVRNSGNAAANAPRAPQASAPALATVIAPDLLGMTAQKATSTATLLGLVVTTVSARAAGFPVGTVIAMRGVSTGERINKGDQITWSSRLGPSTDVPLPGW